MSATADRDLLRRLHSAIMARANRAELLALHDELSACLAQYREVLTIEQVNRLSRATCPACVPGFAGVTVDGDGVATRCTRCTPSQASAQNVPVVAANSEELETGSPE